MKKLELQVEGTSKLDSDSESSGDSDSDSDSDSARRESALRLAVPLAVPVGPPSSSPTPSPESERHTHRDRGRRASDARRLRLTDPARGVGPGAHDTLAVRRFRRIKLWQPECHWQWCTGSALRLQPASGATLSDSESESSRCTTSRCST